MGIAEQISVHVFATVVQLPFHLVIALPLLLAAWAAAAITRQYLSVRPRFVLVSAIAAIGLAPAYGFHLSMIPIYSLAISGDAEPLTVAGSFFATWGFILLIGLAISRFRGRKQPPGSNPMLNTDARQETPRAG